MNKTRFFFILFSLLFCFVGLQAEEFNQNLIKGLDAASKGNLTEAFNYYKQGALEGDKYSDGRLATCYLMGIGTDVDISEGRKWAMKGFNLGNSYSAAMVGYSFLYEYGMDNLDALQMALPYFVYSYNADDREFDNPDMYANLGLLIATTKLMSGDNEEGLQWLEQALNDFPSYTPLLGQAAYSYWSLGDYNKAARFAQIADKDENIQGTFVLGWCLANGEGIKKDETAGFKKIRKAANIGIPEDAMFALGECYYNGIGTAVDKSLGIEWFQKAAEAGVEEAREELQILYYENDFVDLGLPSGNLWRSMNLGAQNESDFGDYFAWGEKLSKDNYTEENYKNKDKSIKNISGNPEYDAAMYLSDGYWQIPSKQDFDELGKYCKAKRTVKNGNNGLELTGPNGNTIFFPASGIKTNYQQKTNTNGSYWTGEPYDDKSAIILMFTPEKYSSGNIPKSWGLSIRPIMKKKK